MARVLSLQGKEEEAIAWNRKIIDYFGTGYGHLALRYGQAARYDDAVATLLEAPSLDDDIPGVGGDIRRWLIIYLLAIRDTGSAEKFISEGEDESVVDENELRTARGLAWDLAGQSEYDQAYEVAAAAVEKAGVTTWWVLNEPAEFAMLAGRYEDAIRLYELGLPGLVDPIRPKVSKQYEGEALYLAHALQMTGETTRAAVLFASILDGLEGRRRIGQENIGIDDACIYASLGDTQRALAAMREAVDVGWRGLYENSLGKPPIMLESLVGHPQFEAMVSEINADLDRQKQNVSMLIK